jgi:pyruvate kinase
MQHNLQFPENLQDPVPEAVAQAAVDISHTVGATGLLVFSVSGNTVKLISRRRPGKPIFALTPKMSIYQQLSLVWGVTPIYLPSIEDVERLIKTGEQMLTHKGLLKNDDMTVIAIGLGFREGSTNVIKIHRVGQDD